MTKLRKEDYTVAWICALPDPEWKASRLLLDEEYEDADISHNSQHQYVYGRMGGHNLVMGCLPSTQIGIGAAASLTAAMVATFPNLKYGLLVGIGGGVPSALHDIRLGDVVVGHPDRVSQDGGVVQYDSGKAISGGQIQSTGMLNLPPYAVLSAISKIRSSPSAHVQFESHLSKLTTIADFVRPDVLVSANLERQQRVNDQPVVHYGRIATGNLVIKDAHTRDQLSLRHGGVLCFEMEAAGLLNQLPCMVIRGICDYCDEHKSKDWQAYAAAAAAAWTRMLLEQMSPPVTIHQAIDQAMPSRTSRWTVPFARDHDFVGRHDVMEKIESVLSRPHYHNRIALTGLGGIGKTQIAIEYCYQYRERRPDHRVLWVPASTTIRLEQALKEIAKDASVPPDFDTHAQLEFAKDWLSDPDNGNWLIVLDNADDVAVFFADSTSPSQKPLAQYLPHCSHGNILVTSRNDTGRDLTGGKVEPIEKFAIEEARELLIKKLPQAEYDPHTDDLLDELERLPLAISQAAAYMSRCRMTISRYLDAYNQNEHNQHALLSKEWRDIRSDSLVPNTVLTTWRISLEQIQHDSPLATQILSIMSVYDRQGVPRRLLLEDAIDPLDADEAIGLLLAYSLISLSGPSTYTMHRLVYIAIRAWLGVDVLSSWYLRAQSVLDRSARGNMNDSQVIANANALMPHCEKVLAYTMELDTQQQSLSLLRDVGHFYASTSNFHKAELYFGKVLNSLLERPDWIRLEVVDAMIDVAISYNDQSGYDKAESMFKKALAYLGESPPDLAKSASIKCYLAGLYCKQGQFSKAEALQREGQAELEASGEDDPYCSIDAIFILGHILREQGKFQQAEIAYHKAVHISMRACGPNHLRTLHASSRLGELMLANNRPQAALDLLEKAANRLPELTPLNIARSDVVLALGWAYAAMSRLPEAERIFAEVQEALKTYSWPSILEMVIAAQRGQAGVLQGMGRSQEALDLARRAQRAADTQFGLNSTCSLYTKATLALITYRHGLWKEAETLYQQTVDGLVTRLGPEHPDFVQCRENLSIVTDAIKTGTWKDMKWA